jgi:hypothetical protein
MSATLIVLVCGPGKGFFAAKAGCEGKKPPFDICMHISKGVEEEA